MSLMEISTCNNDVKVLRKDHEGGVFAELDASDVRHIPVTKRYYDSLSALL